ncbi:MAG: helix-turn-helix transcriptional regulator [Acidimicrobiales bacterium]
MRADRLVAILLLLQRRGQVTAAQVAEELEVSPRTARRDLEALGQAGLPVYSVPGRNGGWRLLGEGRTDLSGLSSTEAVALYALVGAAAGGADAALAGETRAALRKLSSALPEPMRDAAERAASSIRVAGISGARPGSGRAVLGAVRRSVVTARRAVLDYTDRDGEPTSRTVDPLGLVARQRHWYLIAGTEAGQRTFRLDRIDRYELTGQPAVRPEHFDIDEAWDRVEAVIDDLRWSVGASIRIQPRLVGRLRFALGDRLTVGGSAPDGSTTATVRGWSVTELAAALAGFHPGVVVDEPPELKEALAGVGRALAAEYGPGAPGGAPENVRGGAPEGVRKMYGPGAPGGALENVRSGRAP